jgi:hypothetical protein
MNQGSETKQYARGDDVRIQLKAVHDQGLDLRNVIATFEREGHRQDAAAGHEIERIELTTPNLKREELRLQPTGTPRDTSSHGVLSGRVPANAALGAYRLRSIEGVHGSGAPIRFSLEEYPEFWFQVVESAFAQPRVTDLKFI